MVNVETMRLKPRELAEGLAPLVLDVWVTRKLRGMRQCLLFPQRELRPSEAKAAWTSHVRHGSAARGLQRLQTHSRPLAMAALVAVFAAWAWQGKAHPQIGDAQHLLETSRAKMDTIQSSAR